MKKTILATIFFTGMIVAGFAGTGTGTDKGNETGSVQGTIIDAETKKPLPNVTFTAMIRKVSFQKDIVTDANGNFKLTNVPVGEHTLVIDKVGYRATKKEGVTVKEGVVYKVEFVEMIPADEEIHQSFISPITIHSF